MFKKLNKKGFTLAELLVVVAIIGVLVAISIPIFTAQLEKAREATDLANIRAAYAECSAAVMTETTTGKATYTKGTGASEVVTLHQTNAGWEDSNKNATIGDKVADTDFKFATGNTKATVAITDAGVLTITLAN